MKKCSTILPLTVVLLSLNNVSFADDITYGVGITWAPQTGFAIGARIFSDDEEDSVVASVGIDYSFKSKSLRPAAGVAYIGDNAYGEISLGYNLGEKTIDYGIGAGYVDAEEEEPVSDSGSSPDTDTDLPL